MTLLISNTDEHKGKVIDRFEDEFGNELSDLHMQDTIIIIFTDGSRIYLGIDTYGSDHYISEYKQKDAK